jgi:hypothetical protein
MKRLSAAMVLGLFFSVFCFAQEPQTGNASYNSSRTGFFISHHTLSFNTHVRVTNLGNNRSVEAVVNGRPVRYDRIAEISREAGDALGMAKTGMTLVKIELIPSVPAKSDPNPGPGSEPEPEPPPAPARENPPPVQRQIPAPAAQEPAPEPEQPAPVTTIRELQYVPVPAPYPEQPCCNKFLFLLILILLLVIIVVLIIILILLLRRFPFWPWRYPLWYKRYLLYLKKRRR